MLQVANLKKSYGERVLFDDVSFAINSGERLGLVGRNGEGKSTLLKILAKDEEADSGEVSTPPGYRIGVLSQHLKFTSKDALSEACLGLPEGQEYDTHKVEATMIGLGFSPEQLQQDPAKLSGGYQIRLNLAKLIASDPNLLLLDEPTNYLDIISMRWLQGFLVNWPGEVLLITHDHGFMNSCATHILGIHRKNIKKLKGTTSKYFSQLEQEEQIYEQSRLNQEKKIKQTEKFIRSFRAKASKAKAVQSKVKSLERMEKLDKLEEISDLDFKFTYTDFPSKRLMEVEDLSFAYDKGPELIKKLSFWVNPTDRIAIIGKNGRGKSTLMRLLVGELQASAGNVKASPNMKPAYFGQTNIETLHPENTIEQELFQLDTVDNLTKARTVAGLMMFEGDDALKRIKVLSGGEKSRVTLGKILLTPANILFLDEPSNHLDMYSNDALLDAVKQFEGAVITVTHSESFLREAANRLLIFDRGNVELFEGDYDDFLRRRGWSDEEGQERDQTDKKKEGKKSKEQRKLVSF